MPDIFTKQKRSEIMSQIHNKDTKLEIIVRKFLFANGFRYRKNDKRYPGKPDIVLPKYKAIVFIHGCFWHGHDCKVGALPKSKQDFWHKKIASNINRDKKNVKIIEESGWKVYIIWGCELIGIFRDNTLEKLKSFLIENKPR
ncbi:very short patch repair endonuclease [Campylobacter sp. MOP51]|uniref:very short patch repair endonuclease n=1 Tax=Campylobacter canis TaxID=3378588 RepID=UPI003C514C76